MADQEQDEKDEEREKDEEDEEDEEDGEDENPYRALLEECREAQVRLRESRDLSTRDMQRLIGSTVLELLSATLELIADDLDEVEDDDETESELPRAMIQAAEWTERTIKSLRGVAGGEPLPPDVAKALVEEIETIRSEVEQKEEVKHAREPKQGG